MYARLFNRDVQGTDRFLGTPVSPQPVLHVSSWDDGAGDDRECGAAPPDDELSLDEDQMVVD